MEEGTDGLRQSANHWSLNGDKKLLDVLQNMHQKIIEKCEETNKRLEEMASALDVTGIHLENVNNKFTALSNSQFIESRVYDDDLTDTIETEKPKEPMKPDPDSEIESMKQSLLVLERMHEAVTIVCDSDSDSGSDDDDLPRLVVKPIDLYSCRPLPYIIGSQAWKNKWHAGLLPEDSDSESVSSKEGRDVDQYSDSEPDLPTESPHHYSKQRTPTISSVSSESLPKEDPMDVLARRTQSDIAAALAKRLGATLIENKNQVQEAEPTLQEQGSAVRKLYTTQQPTTGLIFPDEPPPLEVDQSEESDQDIFAEIYRPYVQSDKDQISVADDLFGKPIFDDKVPQLNPAKQKPTLYQEIVEPESITRQDDISKKPVGGKSIFGSNANSESIGDAILKRKQRRSTSGEESDKEPVQTTNIETSHIKTGSHIKRDEIYVSRPKPNQESQIKRERDIFDDLFAKSERLNKEKIKENEKDPYKKTEKKVDLFSDNIFDDIDDIFTSSVKVKQVDSKKEKSIFDNDSDDLFSEVAVKSVVTANKMNNKYVTQENTLIDDDDDLFSDKRSETNTPKVKQAVVAQVKKIDKMKQKVKSLFDDSDDDLFSDISKTKDVNDKTHNKVEDLISDDSLFTNETSQNIQKVAPKLIVNDDKPRSEGSSNNSKKIIQSPDLFDDEYVDDFMSPGNHLKISENYTADKRKDSKKSIQAEKYEKSRISYDDTIGARLKENTDSGSNIPIFENSAAKTKSKTTESIFDDDLLEEDLFAKPNTKLTNSKTQGLSHEAQDGFTNISIKTNEDISNTKTSEIANKNTEYAASSTVIETQVKIAHNLPESPNSPQATVINIKTTSKPDIAEKPVSVQVVNIITNTDIPEIEKTVDEMDMPKNEEIVVMEDAKDEFEDNFEAQSTSKIIVEPKDPPELKKVVGQDIFGDIFVDQPPDFEKPKEPKKSKNINALFDDDSDDESLFLRKNDEKFDEKPEVFSSNDDRLFGLFIDEPPAIDVDFVQKTKKDQHINIDKDFEKSFTDNDMPSSRKSNTTKEKSSQQNVEYEKNTDVFGDKIADEISDDIFTSKKDLSVKIGKNDPFKKKTDDQLKNTFNTQKDDDDDRLDGVLKGDDDLFKSGTTKTKVEENVNESSDNTDMPDNKQSETKKVGKLKPMNFNINVNTLLPGASPKKNAKNHETTDGQTSSKSHEELRTDDVNKISRTESKLTKSVSFEEKSDSSVLDNKLSKERAKIQVKRRPSTRRARREAVKKSGIDFGEDSTDNSASIDDQPDKTSDINDTVPQAEKANAEYDTDVTQQEISAREVDTKITVCKDESSEETSITNRKDFEVELEVAIKNNEQSIDALPSVDHEDETKINTENTAEAQDIVDKDVTTPTDSSKEVKSKVVYILNDEDIFNTKFKPERTAKSLVITSTISDSDDSDDIFRTMPVVRSQNLDEKTNLYGKSDEKHVSDPNLDRQDENLPKSVSQATANVVSEQTQNSESKALVDHSDSELFKGKKTEKVVNKKVSIFDSDSDDDLFSGKKKIVNNIPKVEKKEANTRYKKKGLFGDDSDDDDLFGVKPKKIADSDPKPQSSTENVTQAKESVMKSETVFEDPLSLFGGEDN